ncbi:MAG: hypothetical protein ACRELC_00020 [Gemmatimonadota bacterium]
MATAHGAPYAEALAATAGPAERAGMACHFELVTRYEIAFWEMALAHEGWPGLAADPPASEGSRVAEG